MQLRIDTNGNEVRYIAENFPLMPNQFFKQWRRNAGTLFLVMADYTELTDEQKEFLDTVPSISAYAIEKEETEQV